MDELQTIEQELQQLISSDKSSWVRIYELMAAVDSKQLWTSKYRSYTAWVNDLAQKTKVHVSLLWSRKKAGKMYSDYQERAEKAGRVVPEIHDIKVSPDNFVLIEKIAGKNTAVADELTDKVLNGVIGRSDLRNAWEKVKADRERAGIQKTLKNRYDKDAEKEKTLSEKEQENEKNLATATDIVLALSDNYWLKDSWKYKGEYYDYKYKLLTEFPVQTGTSRHARRIDGLIIENITAPEKGQLYFHGVEIKVSKSDLFGDHKMQEYTEHVDFFWIAVPESLAEDAQSIMLPNWGLLTFNKGKRISIKVQAAELKPLWRDKTMEKIIEKLI